MKKSELFSWYIWKFGANVHVCVPKEREMNFCKFIEIFACNLFKIAWQQYLFVIVGCRRYSDDDEDNREGGNWERERETVLVCCWHWDGCSWRGTTCQRPYHTGTTGSRSDHRLLLFSFMTKEVWNEWMNTTCSSRPGGGSSRNKMEK